MTVIAPGPGLVFVDTFGGGQPRGTLWQDEVGRGGRPHAGRAARPAAGRARAGRPVVVALQGQGGATGAYAVVVTFVPGYLENPARTPSEWHRGPLRLGM